MWPSARDGLQGQWYNSLAVEPGASRDLRLGLEVTNAEKLMKNLAISILLACTLLGISPVFGQVKMTRDQMLFYTSDTSSPRRR
jgi:hypothetical protein